MPLLRLIASYFLAVIASLAAAQTCFATTKGLSQIVTPDLQPEGDFSLSFQAQSERIGNPYELQGELGLTKWSEVAVFKGFKPNELIFGTELGLIQHEPYLLSVGFVNWSPHSHVDPQSKPVTTPNITNSSRARRTSIIATKRSSGTPTISMRPGARRSISKAARAIHPRLASPVT
ncbi:MAG: hypothetical protein DMF25_05690 [Verrucomicrobia bacterium]|nr:MAG: hypothetical protein DMF25_05690 [Verrucomicrobiota bacterium]